VNVLLGKVVGELKGVFGDVYRRAESSDEGFVERCKEIQEMRAEGLESDRFVARRVSGDGLIRVERGVVKDWDGKGRWALFREKDLETLVQRVKRRQRFGGLDSVPVYVPYGTS
ncbi:hypothetical protein BJ508DRAFT_334321, partial [Ascobolus immersus RN42]